MTIFYSPNTKGFYDDQLGYPSLPDDLIKISHEKYTQLLSGAHNNKDIVNDNGNLILVDKVVTITWDQIRAKRNSLLSKSDYTQILDWSGDKTAWASYRQQLRNIPQTYKNPEDVVWPTPPQ